MRQVNENGGRKGSRRGFTLLEMMVVLGLVIIFATITVMYNKNIGKQIVVSREHAKVLSILIKARSAGFTIPKSPTQSICGYGVHVDAASRTLTFFKDLGVVGSPCASTADHVYTVGQGDSEMIEQVVLDPSVSMTSDMSDIVFIPPFGDVLIDADGTKTTATITIVGASAGVTKAVKVNSYGQITEVTTSTTP